MRAGRGKGGGLAGSRRPPAAHSAAAAILCLSRRRRHKMPPARGRRFFTARGTLGAGAGRCRANHAPSRCLANHRPLSAPRPPAWGGDWALGGTAHAYSAVPRVRAEEGGEGGRALTRS